MNLVEPIRDKKKIEDILIIKLSKLKNYLSFLTIMLLITIIIAWMSKVRRDDDRSK